MKSNLKQLQSRGFLGDNDLRAHIHRPASELVELIAQGTPVQRSAAIRILSEKSHSEYLEIFIDALKHEKSLYTKIELQNALGKIGAPAIPLLVQLLGTIGNNQHKTINNADIKKNTYPIARDLAARILCRIGPESIPYLVDVIKSGTQAQKAEALDALGYLVYHHRCFDREDIVIDVFQSSHDPLLQWKAIKAMQGFTSTRIKNTLQDIINNETNIILKTEAERSLARQRNKEQSINL